MQYEKWMSPINLAGCLSAAVGAALIATQFMQHDRASCSQPSAIAYFCMLYDVLTRYLVRPTPSSTSHLRFKVIGMLGQRSVVSLKQGFPLLSQQGEGKRLG